MSTIPSDVVDLLSRSRDLVRYLQSFVPESVAADLRQSLIAHLGPDLHRMPVVSDDYPIVDRPNLLLALEDFLREQATAHVMLGVAEQLFSSPRLAALARADTDGTRYREGGIAYDTCSIGPDKTMRCPRWALHLVTVHDRRCALLLAQPDRLKDDAAIGVDVLAPTVEEASALLADLRTRARRLDIHRGQVLSFESSILKTNLTFPRLGRVQREEIILPAGVLEKIERHTVGFAEHTARLRAAGRTIRRGILLSGPPGTGKTMTIRYLATRMTDRTVVIVTGHAMSGLSTACGIAARLAPAMVVIEDVDLIGEDRTFGGGPLLHDLMNEMDGVGEDADLIFVLTTNRAEVLEPALAERPGRVDLAVEFPLPDAEGRRRLLESYARGLSVEGIDWDRIVASTAGASPAFLKELLRRAALHAAMAEHRDAPLVVQQADLDAALAELQESGTLSQSMLGFHRDDGTPKKRRRAPSGLL